MAQILVQVRWWYHEIWRCPRVDYLKLDGTEIHINEPWPNDIIIQWADLELEIKLLLARQGLRLCNSSVRCILLGHHEVPKGTTIIWPPELSELQIGRSLKHKKRTVKRMCGIMCPLYPHDRKERLA